MLPVRLAVVTAIAAVCLWGLFSLLDNLSEPGLLRTERAVVVKGCEAPPPDTQSLCAQLRCQKSVLDQKRVPLLTRFDVLRTDHWIGGRAIDPRTQTTLGYFACKAASAPVAAQWLDERQFQALD